MNNKIEEQYLLAIRLHSQWEELWLPVKGYSNYEVSSRGQIRNTKTNTIRKQVLDGRGYCRIKLTRNGTLNTLQVHRLVCTAFYPNKQDKNVLTMLITTEPRIMFKI